MIIGLSGYAKSGKDTAGQMIVELTMGKKANHYTDDHGNNSYTEYEPKPLFDIRKFAGTLKQVASLMTGIPKEKFEDQDFKDGMMPPEWGVMTVREFLQKLGTEGVRNCVHKDAWVIAAMAGYNVDKHWLFTDVRFPNEANAIKSKGGIIIRLNRYPPGCSPVFMDMHESEKSLDNWKFDHVIYNVGTLEDLKNQIKEILNQINQKKDLVNVV